MGSLTPEEMGKAHWMWDPEDKRHIPSCTRKVASHNPDGSIYVLPCLTQLVGDAVKIGDCGQHDDT